MVPFQMTLNDFKCLSKFLPRDAMHKGGQCHHAVSVRHVRDRRSASFIATLDEKQLFAPTAPACIRRPRPEYWRAQRLVWNNRMMWQPDGEKNV